MRRDRLFPLAVGALLSWVMPCAPAVPASQDSTDTIAFCTPYPNGVAPLLSLVRTVDVEGRSTVIGTVLGSAGADPLAVADRVLVHASPLKVGKEERDVPDHVGDAICGETTWALPVNGGGAEELPPYGVLSPGGRRYAFSRFSPGEGRRLWVRADTREAPTPLYMAVDSGKPREILWSPDERHLAADAFAEPLRRGEQVIVVATDTWQARSARLRAIGARWSPDGRRLAWIRMSDATAGHLTPQVEVRDTESGEVTTLAQVPPGTCHLRWSPDGQSLLLLVAPPGGEEPPPQQVWAQPLQQGGPVQVYQARGLGASPFAWTTRGDGFWLRSGQDVLLLGLQEGTAVEQLRFATGAATLTPGDIPADLRRAEGAVLEALTAATRARAAVEGFCTDLGPSRRELARAARILAELPKTCPAACLVPDQCAQYAQAITGWADELPLRACLARMRYLGLQLAMHLLRNGMLPPAPPAGPAQDPRYWVSPGPQMATSFASATALPRGEHPVPARLCWSADPLATA